MRGRVAEAAADVTWRWALLRALLAAPAPEGTRTGRSRRLRSGAASRLSDCNVINIVTLRLVGLPAESGI